MNVSEWSLVAVPVRVVLAILTLMALVGLGIAIWRGSWASRFALGGLSFILVLGFAAAAVNAHYTYFREVGDLFGRKSKFQASASALNSTKVPPTGVVVGLDIPATESRFQARQAQVFVPPAWFRQPRPKLPVVVMLHGDPGGPEDWTRSALADATANEWASQHNGETPILVLPDNNGGFTSDTECVDSSRGNAETYLTVDLPKFVKDRLGTATDAKSWAVVGFSEGGNCALMLALRHPDIFATFADYSGLPGPRVGTNMEVTTEVADLFDGSQVAFEAHEPAKLLERRYPGMAGWFEVANDDGSPLAAAQHLAGLSRKAGIDTCVVTLPTGGHAFPVWTQAFKDSLPWLAARLGLVPVSPEQTRHCRQG